ncbi:chemotaxis protein CheD [Sporolactobacillus sp. Y61]|jgi:chemotaxis protein CheD|uniref:Probable chemoreceptor glutamine deamidase CheD n=2 Tax=unclassified Sporolactobacillus TaxID=2628533 RepID=A0AAU8IDE1_9BACL
MSEIRYVRKPEKMKTMGLGSCVGVVVYHQSSGIAGMAHIMLPDSALSRVRPFSPGKYADTAVPELIHVLSDLHGLPLNGLKAKMAGGAEMFKSFSNAQAGSIGKRNVDAVHRQLNQFGIPVVAEDTGDSYGRTIEFDPESGTLMIQTILHGKLLI